MTHAKKTHASTKPATETPEQQEQEQEAVQELIAELSGDGGEGSEPDDASLSRMDDDGGAFASGSDDSEC